MIWGLVRGVFLQPLNKLYNLIEILYNSSIICQSVASLKGSACANLFRSALAVLTAGHSPSNRPPSYRLNPAQYSNSLYFMFKTTNAHSRCAMVFVVWLGACSHWQTPKNNKATHRVACRFKCGSKGIRTPDPLLVRQMLWTSWAMLPICNAWALQRLASLHFAISFSFKESCHLTKLDRIYCLSVSGISSNHPMAVTIAAYRLLPAFVRPTHLAPEQGLEPRTPWLTVMCSNRLSYSGIC